MTLSVMCLLEAYDSAVVLFEVPNKCLFVCLFSYNQNNKSTILNHGYAECVADQLLPC